MGGDQTSVAALHATYLVLGSVRQDALFHGHAEKTNSQPGMA